MRAQRAKPLVQEVLKLVTATPGYPAVLAWHQLSSSSQTAPGAAGETETGDSPQQVHLLPQHLCFNREGIPEE